MVLLAAMLTSCGGVKQALVSFAGQRQFKMRCASCHDPAVGRAPDKARLAELGRPEILNAMQNGSMRPLSQGLTLAQMYVIAAYLSPESKAATPPPDPPKCSASSKRFALRDGDWPNWGLDLANTRYQRNPGFATDTMPKLKPKWAFTFYGARYAQPTVVGGRVFITSLLGNAYALDAKTGCMYWRFDNSRSRTTITIAAIPTSPSGLAAFFGSSKASDGQTVFAVDANDGKVIWKRRLATHPLGALTGAMTFYRGRLYVSLSSAEELTSSAASYSCCTFRGGIAALDAATGRLLWIAHTIGKAPAPSRKNSAGTQLYGPAGAAVWSAPTVDAKRALLYVATGDSYTEVKEDGSDAVIAIDLKSGAIAWKTQVTQNDNYLSGCEIRPLVNCPTPLGHDFDFGAPPIVANLANGHEIVLAGQKSGSVYGFDPANGHLEWKTQVGHGGTLGGIEWGMATDEKRLYVANADAYMPAPPGRPGLVALDPASGRELWFAPSPHLPCGWTGAAACLNGVSSPPTVANGLVLAGDMNGRLRAYAADTGKIVFEVDTGAQRYHTVNGVLDQPGGNIDGAAGPVVVDGMIYVISGYLGFHGGSPNNVLIAFSAK